MKKKRLLEISHRSICSIILFLFIYTAYAKIADHAAFANVLSKAILIAPIAALVAWLVPVTEIAIAILLLLPGTQKAGLIASLILMTVFTIYLVFMLLNASTLPCHCGGVISKMSWEQHIWFNVFFILLSTFGIAIHKYNSQDPLTF